MPLINCARKAMNLMKEVENVAVWDIGWDLSRSRFLMNELITKGTTEGMKGKSQKQNLSNGQNCYCMHFWKSVRHQSINIGVEFSNCSEAASENIFV